MNEGVRADWPEFGLADDIRPALAAARASGEPAALATLFAATGGAPRGIGAQMLITRGGVTGYVSGGCIEADIALHAMNVLDDGAPCRLVYGDGGPVDIRLPCGGRVEVLVERITPDDRYAARLLDLTRRRQPALWVSDGTSRAALAEGESERGLPADLRAAVVDARASRPCRGPAIHRAFLPTRRLVVLGGDPTALAISMMAARMGHEVFVVRPAGPDTPPPVVGAHYLREEPAAALARIGIDAWTAVVVAMHDDIRDHEALRASLPSAAFYVGLLGSRRRLAEKLARLRAGGLPDTLLAQLHAPIGLPLGGTSPWDIALSVLAEITQETQAARRTAWPVADARIA